MSMFGASRFTAMLATMAILGTAGSLSWAIANRADMKSDAAGRAADRASSSKSASRAWRVKDERANKFASMMKSERTRSIPFVPAALSDSRDQMRERSIAPQLFADNVSPSLQGRGADMPVPIPPVVQAEPESRQAKSPVEQVSGPPSSAESQKRVARDPEPAAAARQNAPKVATRSSYVEKFVEQGDAGEVKFRYRRQSCEPPNMPDVCFMPQENRRNIVVERR